MANVVLLIGRTTKDVEIRYMPETQNAVGRFTLAVDKIVKDKGADFINIVTFGKTAELCEKYLLKGKKVCVQGKLNTGSYKNKDGATVYTTDVIADRVEFLEWGDKTEDKPKSSVPNGFQAQEETDDIPF